MLILANIRIVFLSKYGKVSKHIFDIPDYGPCLKCMLYFIQIQKVIIALGDYMETQCHACIGGTSVRDGISKLEQGQHVVVGTPGCVFDMINRGALSKYEH